LKEWNNQFPGFSPNSIQWKDRWKNKLNSGVNKSPWQPEEELIFITKHKSYGNKWTEISKSLEGRNDNAVKNHFYSRELTIYLAQYMLEMYQGYLGKKKLEKNLNFENGVIKKDDHAEMEWEINEENKTKDINAK